ncbi:ROK family protein [Paludibaculum fermentans]|uniref:fructokinase n=1 Tax=Paludibaculum fermentans TaxID=1473598 RepID=A0A7S7SHF9_PALFE|nr:ROK family protein [Paludibaculum fermentans]QOY84909.1 ROK family protein [Paludibaculum fermentans]
MSLYGAVEAGGTKFVVAVGDDPLQPRDVRRFSTSNNPLETVSEVVEYFRERGPLKGVGVATFGPIDFASGAITNTPKLAWQNFPLRDALRRGLNVPVGFDTDVNGAALGEARCGAGKGLENLVYITVGTGIGGGALVGGQLVHGLMHPEMGHLLVRRAPGEIAEFKGVCPFHGDCLEGLASGPAMQARWGVPADELAPEHEAWRIEADYLAQACVNLACVVSPQVIVLGGGVMGQRHLFPLVRTRAEELSQGYLPLPAIVPPGLEYPGLSGAFVLAMECV